MPPSPCPEGTFYPYSKGYVPYRFTQDTLPLSWRNILSLPTGLHPLPVKEHSILIVKGMYHTGLHMPPSPCPIQVYPVLKEHYIPIVKGMYIQVYTCHPPPVLKEHSILIVKGMYHTGLHMPPSPCPEGTFYPYSKGYVSYRFTQATLPLSWKNILSL